ncbi:hypothetical protein M8C21_010078 [Ambrosia artemisiifolia]|uniref:phosphatidylserine decarboxylase n=1 Tax=Ambrosia artemisiifolia TaxID=4212 RepID=A0AAD5CXA6_AMBAR|nr:hypothetical protein M8C21_010078 [Ambrosia artemisiifolia]
MQTQTSITIFQRTTVLLVPLFILKADTHHMKQTHETISNSPEHQQGLLVLFSTKTEITARFQMRSRIQISNNNKLKQTDDNHRTSAASPRLMEARVVETYDSDYASTAVVAVGNLHAATKQPPPSFNGNGNGSSSNSSKGNPFLVPGATVATIFMLGALHARRMYSDKKIEEARESGVEFELQPDVKAKFLRMLPLRSISRFWGVLSGTISPVDGTIVRVGELKEGVMIEQVKGFSYSVSSLLGVGSFLPLMAAKDIHEQDSSQQEKNIKDESRLYPVNERATRTIKNLYVENERVVLEGKWQEGYIAMAAVGATNIGSIELFIEPDLRTNQPRKKLVQSEAPEERVYEPEGTGVLLKKGDEVGVFNMGSTVVLVFQAPALSSSEFRFSVEKGDKIRMGEALGRLHHL